MIIGNFYKTACFVMLDENNNLTNKIIPIIDFLHNDPEIGQNMPHYHIDDRFFTLDTETKIFGKEKIYEIVENFSNIVVENSIVSCDGQLKGKIVYLDLKLLRNNLTTTFEFGGYSIINYKKDKCPHRGFDLTNTLMDENGVKTCPLHGLKVKKCKI